MRKDEIAQRRGLGVETIWSWTRHFPEWFDIDSLSLQKRHDELDFFIYRLISDIDRMIPDDVGRDQRIDRIMTGLCASPEANSIKNRRNVEKARPESKRWGIVGASKSDYEWLKPLGPFVDAIVSFGCWASDTYQTCSEPYSLLWILDASRIVVVDKEEEYIGNARTWLKNTRTTEPYFNDYDLKFRVGDLTENDLIETADELAERAFDLSYCEAVLKSFTDNMMDLQNAIDVMARVVQPGGWVIAVERTIDVGLIGPFFEKCGLRKCNLDDAPEGAHCYKKPLDGS